jgi:N-acetyl-anhydromuramyl-L-alanine amidase AmpD
MGTGTGEDDLSAWDVECMDRDRGCNGLGCHYVILRDGDVVGHRNYPAARSEEVVGNVDSRYNDNSIFVTLVGSDDWYTEAQREVLSGFIEYLQGPYPEAEPLYQTIV